MCFQTFASGLLTVNKVLIPLGEDPTKMFIFGSKRKLKKAGKRNSTNKGKNIRQKNLISYAVNKIFNTSTKKVCTQHFNILVYFNHACPT